MCTREPLLFSPRLFCVVLLSRLFPVESCDSFLSGCLAIYFGNVCTSRYRQLVGLEIYCPRLIPNGYLISRLTRRSADTSINHSKVVAILSHRSSSWHTFRAGIHHYSKRYRCYIQRRYCRGRIFPVIYVRRICVQARFQLATRRKYVRLCSVFACQLELWPLLSYSSV